MLDGLGVASTTKRPYSLVADLPGVGPSLAVRADAATTAGLGSARWHTAGAYGGAAAGHQPYARSRDAMGRDVGTTASGQQGWGVGAGAQPEAPSLGRAGATQWPGAPLTVPGASGWNPPFSLASDPSDAQKRQRVVGGSGWQPPHAVPSQALGLASSAVAGNPGLLAFAPPSVQQHACSQHSRPHLYQQQRQDPAAAEHARVLWGPTQPLSVPGEALRGVPQHLLPPSLQQQQYRQPLTALQPQSRQDTPGPRFMAWQPEKREGAPQREPAWGVVDAASRAHSPTNADARSSNEND